MQPIPNSWVSHRVLVKYEDFFRNLSRRPVQTMDPGKNSVQTSTVVDRSDARLDLLAAKFPSALLRADAQLGPCVVHLPVVRYCDLRGATCLRPCVNSSERLLLPQDQ